MMTRNNSMDGKIKFVSLPIADRDFFFFKAIQKEK
jgi:hypothetical protein